MNRAALKPANLWSMIRESVSRWSDDFAPSMGAALAYYTVFSIAPMIIIIIAIAGFFLGREAASGEIYAQISGLVGDNGAKVVQSAVQSASSRSEGIIATVISVVVLLIGATSVFAELQTDLDRIFKAPAAANSEGIWGMLKSRLLSLGLVVSMGFILLVSLVVSAALSALGKWWGGVFGDMEWLLQIVNFVVSLGIITLMFALMYKVLPRVKIAWHDVWIGALVTALLFTIGKLLVGLYLGKSSVASAFGAAGSLAVLLVWVYYSAQIFLLGAEFTEVYAHRYGSRRNEEAPATEKEQKAGTSKPTQAQPNPQTRPQPAMARPRRSPPPRPGVAGVAQRHAGLIAASALVLGALASEVLQRMQRRRSRLARLFGA